jgi:hypothetical protein
VAKSCSSSFTEANGKGKGSSWFQPFSPSERRDSCTEPGFEAAVIADQRLCVFRDPLQDADAPQARGGRRLLRLAQEDLKARYQNYQQLAGLKYEASSKE